MKTEPSLAHDADRRAAAADFARARSDYAAGRGVDHLVVSEWLRTWGDAEYRPFGEWLTTRDD